MIPLLESPAAQRLAWTLLHFLWQGALLGLAAWVAFTLLRRQRPQLRYLVGCACLLACLGSAILTYGLLVPTLQASSQSMDLATLGTHSPEIQVGPIARPEVASSDATLPWQARLQPYLSWILATWAAGVLILSLRAAGGWFWLRRLKAAATPVTEPEWLERLVRSAGLRRAVRFLESARVITPMCMGLLRPVILLPLGFFANLDPLAAEAVLAHELAHIRRLDGLVNGLQCAIEVLLFFHPAVWWISRRIRTEREHCCDDAAVLACGDAIYYAETLSRLDELRDRPFSLALQARGGNLMERLRRLLLADPPQFRFATPSLAIVAILALVGSLPAQAVKSEPAPKPEELRAILTKPQAQPTPATYPVPVPLPLSSLTAMILPAAPGQVLTPTPPPASPSVPTPTIQDSQAAPVPGPTGLAPVQEPTPGVHPVSVPVFQAKDLEVIPGLATRTLKVPRCPAIIEDELLTWPDKGYAVEAPAHTTVALRVKCESGEAYFRVGVSDKWGKWLPGMKGSLGLPWASFNNGSDRPTTVYFFVRTGRNYPGDGKVQIHLGQQAIPGNLESGARPASTSQGQPSRGQTIPLAGAEPTQEEARQIIQAFADQRPWGDSYGQIISQVRILGREHWNGAYTGQWPTVPENKPVVQAIKRLEGWAVSFQIQNLNQPVTLTVLLDKDGVIHWRKVWPALPPGLRTFGTNR